MYTIHIRTDMKLPHAIADLSLQSDFGRHLNSLEMSAVVLQIIWDSIYQ